MGPVKKNPQTSFETENGSGGSVMGDESMNLLCLFPALELQIDL